MRPTRIRDDMMKKTLKVMAMVLFVVGMTALTTACTKGKSDLILGKWKFEKAVVSYGGESIQMTASDIAQMLGVEFDEKELIINFKSDGYVYGGSEEDPARYTLEGDELTIITPEESFKMIITKLTSSALIVEPHFDGEMPEGTKAEIRFKKA